MPLIAAASSAGQSSTEVPFYATSVHAFGEGPFAAGRAAGSGGNAISWSPGARAYCDKQRVREVDCNALRSAKSPLCRQLGVRQSMEAVGTSADNAAAEALNVTFKREILQSAKRWPSVQATRRLGLRLVHPLQHRRRHSSLGYYSPIDYEQQPDVMAVA